ncbi:hypothetical protein ACSBR1_002032 [Camellia fascicularis]
MASLPFTPLLLNLLVSLIFLLLISPSHSLKCTSQTFTNKKLYTNCTDLPYLSAYLHWTYDSTKSSLSIAFIAPPAKSNGWIAWAINPTGTGMAGAQSLIAFKQSNGSMTVNTYNISSYSSILKSKIAFDVPEKSAEYSGGVMKIFATLRLPKDTASVNQVWQVGGAVDHGIPVKHAFEAANLNAKGTLDLVRSAASNAPAPAPAPSEGPSSSENVGVSRIGNCNFGLISMLLFLASFVIRF